MKRFNPYLWSLIFLRIMTWTSCQDNGQHEALLDNTVQVKPLRTYQIMRSLTPPSCWSGWRMYLLVLAGISTK
ncbi:hypothetical protein [Echinicola pacifica]|uniref:hypothetical protein n=1 Tax=Echinicola pacifica TaxID=346377 RepID=UPI00035FDD0D|nr:hypothetical protein [Echinicola pacifica]